MQPNLFKKSFSLLTAVAIASVALISLPAQAVKVRIKDITHVKGVRNNQLVGYGLVTGLAKTGDKSMSTQNASFNLIQIIFMIIMNQELRLLFKT